MMPVIITQHAAQRYCERVNPRLTPAEASAAIMSCGADEETAKKIVVAILAGEIPNVTLRF